MTNDIKRYSDRSLPFYSYVPGLSPHPTSDPRGHSFGKVEPPAQPLEEATYRGNATYLHAIDLFNHGYYWEAHEAWESLWHAAGRRGVTADFLKGLIKLAAAGVKMREGRVAGLRQHAHRAAELFHDVLDESTSSDCFYGLRLNDLIATAVEIGRSGDQLVSSCAANAGRYLPIALRLG
jgi:hypothetical protein